MHPLEGVCTLAHTHTSESYIHLGIKIPSLEPLGFKTMFHIACFGYEAIYMVSKIGNDK